MCGIAGFVNGDGTEADRGVLARMTATLAHRGPDGDGLHLDGPAALGHRRLAIIDLDTGAQPMSNEDGTVWVTYNGELYNEPDLRARLIARGHHFRTASDTEALVHQYEDDGPDFAAALNGMFALAIWDHRRRRLVLARDRMGQKPLYYAEVGRGIAFASEPKALLAHPEVGRALDPRGLARYLVYEYVPAPHSIWAGVRKLPRAHVLVWEEGRVALRRYWEPPPVDPEAPPFDDAVGRFWGGFRDAVGRHRRADVPLGVFLSGGIDSSGVAAALASIGPASAVKTFSIGFDDPSFDESRFAREVARALGTDHHERTFGPDDVLALLPEVAGWLDEPLGDASILPTHLLSRFAREHVKVALGGDGSDELLAGYPTFAAERAARWFRLLPGPARSLVGAAVRGLPVDHGNLSLDFKLKQFLRGAGEPAALAHQRWMGSFGGPDLTALLIDGEELGREVEAEHLTRAASVAPAGADALTRALRLYQETYLAEDILTKVDRASMACGLEVRAPFLDAELVDQVEALPARYKLRNGRGKRLLRAALRGRIPDSVLDRPKKGFGIPVARWLRGPLGPLLDDLLSADHLAAQGLFRPEEVARLVREHRRGIRDHRKGLWTLLVFQLWADRWLEVPAGSAVPPVPA